MTVPSRLTIPRRQSHSSAPSSPWSNGWERKAVLVVNAMGAAAVAAFATFGLARPGYAHPDSSTNSPTEFWAASSAMRTWAITAPVLTEIIRGRSPTPQLLTAAGLVQLGDSALGVWQRNPSMAILPAAMGLIHLRSARLLSR